MRTYPMSRMPFELEPKCPICGKRYGVADEIEQCRKEPYECVTNYGDKHYDGIGISDTWIVKCARCKMHYKVKQTARIRVCDKNGNEIWWKQ